MIIKNGEILAIDHIAHDNTLSGNGTSAKPVGLSQSTKNSINNKVEKTDFETYKSSVANQIRDINNTIAADESSLESYKETVAANFTAVNDRITDVANAKQDKGNYVSATNFNDFKNTVEGQIEALETGKQPVGDYVVTNDFNSYKETVDGKFTTVNERITNVANAKQDKGDYVSASDFNTYKTDVAGEIARVDGRIDTTNTNLENNYYKKNQTYSQSEVDEIVSKLGAYVYVENVTSEGYPIVDEPSTKVIYLTQIPNETQCLQWIWLETQEWKCIGDTTMNLSAYATKEWTNNNFETIDQFNTAIANYYTKGEVNAELATKVDNDDFNAYKTEVNGKFATKQNLTDTKAELEDTIESVSGEIISKVNTDYRILDGEIDAIATTLSNDYYTSLEIDAILAASGEYYTKTESDNKYTEKSVFEASINELSLNKLDKSATANWDVTEYTEGENIKIVGHEISGKDWSNEIAAAVENKVDESELENYVTNDEFNILDNKVGLIDNDLDTLSGKTVTVIKDSETVKAIRSTEPDGTISYTLSAHDGKQADYLWKPTVNAAGDISWELALTGDTPATANIKGSNGDNGKTPELTSENYHIKWKYTDESIWNDLGDFRGASGADGITPHIGENNHWFIGDVDTNIPATGPQGEDGVSPTVVTGDAVTSEEHKNGGITITVTDKTGDQTFTAWNGNDGTMAGAPGITGYDGITARNTGTTYEIGLSSDYKAAIQSVSSKLDESDFTTYTTTTAPAAFQPKGDYVSANEITDMATKTWVGQQKYLIEVATSGSIIGTGLSTNKIGLVTSAENALTAVANKANAADVYSKTDADDKFVTSDGITTQGTDYVMTTTGWKVLSLPGGGMTQVIHDTTLTGQGNADNDKLGVAWSALSGNTIASALSAGSATVAANLGISSFADITGAINAKADATAISDMLTKTEAAQIYQPIAGMSNYLTTAQYETDSAKYVVTGDILTAASNKLTGIKVGNTDYTIQETNWTTTIQTASAKAYNDATANANELYVTKTSAHNEFVNTSSWANTAFQPKGNYVATADLLINASNQLTGIKIDNSTNYPIPLFGGVTADNSTITGDGNTNPLGVAWSALSGNTITSALSAGSATSAYSAYSASYATTAASAYIDSNITSAMSDIVDELHGKLDLTGGTVSGQVTVSGSNFDNNLHLKRDNNNGFIGLANNGAITIKNVISNSTSQIEFLTSANKTFDITVKDNNSTPQPVGKLYVMSAHSLADATTTSANWANDGMLHIILES